MIGTQIRRTVGGWGRAPWLLLLAVMAGGALSPWGPAEALLIERPSLPDALTAADSSRAVVIATCARGNTYERPAVFRVTRRLGGTIPNSFTAHPISRGARGDYVFREGWRYALLLRDPPPPIGPEFRRLFRWRENAEFEVWHSDVAWTPVAKAPGDSTLGALYQSIWKMPRLSRAERVAAVTNWARSGDPALGWADEVIRRHPDLWGTPLRDYFLERLRVGWDLNQEWAARQLSSHADSTTHRVLVAMAGGDSMQRRLAVILGSRDSTAWVRRRLLAITDEALSGIPGPLPYLLRPGTPDMERWGPTLRFLGALTDALSPANSEAERLALIRIAQRARPRHWLRYAALRPLAHDSSRVVRELIWETVRGDSASMTFWVEDAPEPDEVTPYWTVDELHRALRDSSSIVRFFAYNEASRRHDVEIADTLTAWLDQNRVPGRSEIQLNEAVTMIKVLGEIRSPAALPKIMEWAEVDNDEVRVAVMDALGSLGDRRAGPVFRRLAGVSCDHMEYFAKRSLAIGLSAVGDSTDVPLFTQWARDCPDVRDVALEAVGVLGGVERMVRLIREIETEPMKPEQMRDYELLEGRVRERAALRIRPTMREHH